MEGWVQIQITFANSEEAEDLVTKMLDARLVACGQVSEVISHYNWQGERQKEKEYLLTLKTRAELYNKCERFIKEHHSYTTPQIIAINIKHGEKEYLNWITDSTKGAK